MEDWSTKKHMEEDVGMIEKCLVVCHLCIREGCKAGEVLPTLKGSCPGKIVSTVSKAIEDLENGTFRGPHYNSME